MTSPRNVFQWSSQGLPAGGSPGPTRLEESLDPVARDHASSAAELVREASAAVLRWLQDAGDYGGFRDSQDSQDSRDDHDDHDDHDDRDDGGSGAGEDCGAGWERLRTELTRELVTLTESQGWRGPFACWFDALDRTLAAGLAGEFQAPAREVLAEELGLWLGGHGAGTDEWNGEPLASGRRLPDRARCVEALLADLQRGEVIAVHGWSETVQMALEEVHGRGLAPEIVLSEGGPDLGGRRMARHLANAGAKVRLVYDTALFGVLQRADRMWLGTEAIGAEAFLGRVGTRALAQEARRLGVPCAILTTSDKLMPAGELRTPNWCEQATWLLWEHAPEGVRLDSQAFEAVPLDIPDHFATEHGLLNAAQLSLRSLRTGERV